MVAGRTAAIRSAAHDDRGEPAGGVATASRRRPRRGRASTTATSSMPASASAVATASVESLVVKMHRAIARPDAVSADVGRGRRGEHDARPVVVRRRRSAARWRRSRARCAPARMCHSRPSVDRRRAALGDRRRSRGRRRRARSPAGGAGHPAARQAHRPRRSTGPSSTRMTRSPRRAASSGSRARPAPAADHQRLAVGVRPVEPADGPGAGPAGRRPGRPQASSPSTSSTCVARSIGSSARPVRTATSAFGSSGPAVITPARPPVVEARRTTSRRRSRAAPRRACRPRTPS